jgi:hypothetical protein
MRAGGAAFPIGHSTRPEAVSVVSGYNYFRETGKSAVPKRVWSANTLH